MTAMIPTSAILLLSKESSKEAPCARLFLLSGFISLPSLRMPQLRHVRQERSINLAGVSHPLEARLNALRLLEPHLLVQRRSLNIQWQGKIIQML